MKKRLPALLLALSMLAPLPARAAQPETPPVSPWACEAMYEALALGLWEADGTDSVLEEITDEQLERIGSIVSDRLALLLMDMYQKYEKNGVLQISSTRQELSDSSGLCVKTVNRAVKKFEDDGWISRQGNKISIDMEQYEMIRGFISKIIEQ